MTGGEPGDSAIDPLYILVSCVPEKLMEILLLGDQRQMSYYGPRVESPAVGMRCMRVGYGST